MDDRTCSIAGCEKPCQKGLRMCSMHYSRLTRTGTTDPGPRARPASERFWSRVSKAPGDGCWLWTGTTNSSGYGRFDAGVYAHRYSWSLHAGEDIPEGMHVDHTCHTPACVRPSHLQVVSVAENNQNHNGAMRTSKTGIRGVGWHKVKRKWRARAQLGDVVLCAYFDNINEAAEAVVEMRNRLHTNNLLDRIELPGPGEPHTPRATVAQRAGR